MIVPGIMLGILCGVMALIPPKDVPPEVKDLVRHEKKVVIYYVPGNPQSRRYKIGEIDWKRMEK